MKDLVNIPERFHSLFLTDWNKGTESKMTSTERASMAELFLEYNRWDIQRIINSKKPVQKEIMVGFVD
jgi:hypothetical protein